MRAAIWKINNFSIITSISSVLLYTISFAKNKQKFALVFLMLEVAQQVT